MNDGGFPGRIHFIAHAIRDICDRLIYALDPQLEGTRVQYENELDKIERDWPQLESVARGAEQQDDPEAVSIDRRVAIRIDSLVKAHRERRQRPSNAELLFRHLMRKQPEQAAVNERAVRDFRRLRKRFMGWTHLRASESSPVDETELRAKFSGFERMLHSFVGDFFTGTKDIDEILRDANR